MPVLTAKKTGPQMSHQAKVGVFEKHFGDKIDDPGSFTEAERIERTRNKNAQQMAKAYYDIVTENYEQGWGRYFHYCRFPVSNLPIRAMMARHNHYLAHWLTLRPGMRVLDIGCGVGEPGRAIAQFAGCEVVGLNINGYQLQKAKVYTREEGLSHLCTYVEGDFMDMPFQDEYFDAIFSVEVICHAPDLQKAHQEVFRVLKKGGKYGFYEEGMTEKFDVSVPEHRKIRNGIERGNGIAKMPMVKEVRESVKAAGFIIEVEEDGMAKGDALPWYWPLEGKVSLVRDWHDFQVVLMLTWFIKFLQYYALWIQEIIGLQDKGRTRTLDTLHFSVNGYRDGGRLGIFTPLQMFICEKPKESLRGKGD